MRHKQNQRRVLKMCRHRGSEKTAEATKALSDHRNHNFTVFEQLIVKKRQESHAF